MTKLCFGYNPRFRSVFLYDASEYPPPLDIHDDSMGESFKRWKRQLMVYLTASGTSEKPNRVQTAVILHCAGPALIDAYRLL